MFQLWKLLTFIGFSSEKPIENNQFDNNINFKFYEIFNGSFWINHFWPVQWISWANKPSNWIELSTDFSQTFSNPKLCNHFSYFFSVLGHRIPELPIPLFNVYPASKYALTAITQTIRQELAYQKASIKLTVRIISTNCNLFVCLISSYRSPISIKLLHLENRLANIQMKHCCFW